MKPSSSKSSHVTRTRSQKRDNANRVYFSHNQPRTENDIIIQVKSVKVEANTKPEIMDEVETSRVSQFVHSNDEIIEHFVTEEVDLSTHAGIQEEIDVVREEAEETRTISDLEIKIKSVQEVNSSLKQTIVELAGDLKAAQDENESLKKIRDNQVPEAQPSAGRSVKRARTEEAFDEYEPEAISLGNQVATEANMAAVIFGHLNLDDLLKCRLISKTWKEAVDSYLEDPSPRIDSSVGTTNNPSASRKKEIIDELDKRAIFSDQTSMNIFARQFRAYARSPFVGRCLTFSLTPKTLQMEEFKSNILGNLGPPEFKDYNEEAFTVDVTIVKMGRLMNLNFWSRVEAFLERFGSHVWHLIIHQETCGLTPARLYEILRACLQYTPNLKTLVINGTFQKFFEKPERTIKKETPKKSTARKSTGGGLDSRIKMCRVYNIHRNSFSRRRYNMEESIKSESLPSLPSVRGVKCFLKETIVEKRPEPLENYTTYKKDIQAAWSSGLLKSFEDLEEFQVNFTLIEQEDNTYSEEESEKSSEELSSDESS